MIHWNTGLDNLPWHDLGSTRLSYGQENHQIGEQCGESSEQ